MKFKNGDKVLIDLSIDAYLPARTEFKQRMKENNCTYLIVHHAGNMTCDLHAQNGAYIGAAIFECLKPFCADMTLFEYALQNGGIIRG